MRDTDLKLYHDIAVTINDDMKIVTFNAIFQHQHTALKAVQITNTDPENLSLIR